MFRKIKIKLNGKFYKFEEITVGEYWILTEDYEQFLDDYFEKYDLDYKKIKNKDLEKILLEILPKNDDVLDLFPEKEKIEKQKFHRIIGTFMYIMKTSYFDVINMPFSVFINISEDLPFIIGEKEDKSSVNNFSGKPEKEKLKELFG